MGDGYGQRGVAQIFRPAHVTRSCSQSTLAMRPALHGALRASFREMKREEGERGRARERDARGPGSMFHRAREIIARPAVGTRLYLIG